MSYCNVEDKPIVVYKFNGAERRYRPPKSPIDVEVVNLPFDFTSGGQGDIFYVFRYLNTITGQYNFIFSNSTNQSSRVALKGAIASIAYKSFDTSLSSSQGFRTYEMCNYTQCVTGYTHRTLGFSDDGSAVFPVEPIPRDNVPDNYGDPPAKARINVYYNGQVIFTDVGNAPGSFYVLCGTEKCPPETCCECDCGDVICCYGSQGQVLKTIPK